MDKPFVLAVCVVLLLFVFTCVAVRDANRYEDLTVRCVGVLGNATGQLLECRELSNACMSALKTGDAQTYRPKIYVTDEHTQWMWSFNRTLFESSNYKTTVSNKTTVYVAVRGLYPAEENYTQRQIATMVFRDKLMKEITYGW